MTHEKLVFRFEPDTTSGLPHLVDPTGCLSAAVHADWEAELNGRCNDQSLRAGATIRFATKAKNVPSEFLVRSENGACNRMPIYVLEPVEAPRAKPEAAASQTVVANSQPALTLPGNAAVPSSPTDLAQVWPMGFLLAAWKLANESQADRMGRLGLQFVLEELDDLALGHPEELLVLLLSAYTATRKLACNGNPTMVREEQFYDRAMEALGTPLLAVAAESHMGPLSTLIDAVSRCLGRKTGT
jgi:hypothetical protein